MTSRDDSGPSSPRGALSPVTAPWNAAKSTACTRRPVSRQSARRPNVAAGPGTGADQPHSLPQRGPSLPTKSPSAAHRGAMRAPSQPSGPHERSECDPGAFPASRICWGSVHGRHPPTPRRLGVKVASNRTKNSRRCLAPLGGRGNILMLPRWSSEHPRIGCNGSANLTVPQPPLSPLH